MTPPPPMPDGKPDPLEELKRVAVEYRRVGCQEEHHVSPGVTVDGTIEIGCACWMCDKMDTAIAAWEKERALLQGWTIEQTVAELDSRGEALKALRAAVTSVLSEIRAVEYPDDQITPAFRECFDYVADALDAALRGSK